MQQRTKTLNLLLLILSISGLSGCFNASWMYQRETPEALRDFAEQRVQLLLAKDSAALLANDDEQAGQAATQQLASDVAQALAALPSTQPSNSHWLAYTALSPTQLVVNYELEYPEQWAQLSLLINVAEQYQLAGIQLNFASASLASQNAFSFSDKSWLHYAFLFACFLMPLLVLATLWLVIKTPQLRFRWLWLLVTLIAFPVFNLNWTSGDWNMQWASIRLAGMNYYRLGDFGPWVLSFGMPIGAVLALIRTRLLQARDETSDAN